MTVLAYRSFLWHPRDHLQLHHEVRRGHQEGPVRQHRHVRRHHHVPRYADRMQKEITALAPSTIKIKIIAPPRGSTPSGSEAPSSPPSPPSSRCGSPSRSTTSAAPPSCTGSASKCLNIP